VQVKKPEDSKYPWDYYQILARIPGERAFGPQSGLPAGQRLIAITLSRSRLRRSR